MGKAIVKKKWENQLREMVDLIKKGCKVYKFTERKPVLDGTRLRLDWKDTKQTLEKDAALALLWDVVPYTKDDARPGTIMARSALNQEGKASVFIYHVPCLVDQGKANGKATLAEAVDWINQGKPCAARCSFAFKGARGGRISTGYAIEKLLAKDYYELCIEQNFGDDHQAVLMFQSYSGSDWD